MDIVEFVVTQKASYYLSLPNMTLQQKQRLCHICLMKCLLTGVLTIKKITSESESCRTGQLGFEISHFPNIIVAGFE